MITPPKLGSPKSLRKLHEMKRNLSPNSSEDITNYDGFIRVDSDIDKLQDPMISIDTAPSRREYITDKLNQTMNTIYSLKKVKKPRLMPKKFWIVDPESNSVYRARERTSKRKLF